MGFEGLNGIAAPRAVAMAWRAGIARAAWAPDGRTPDCINGKARNGRNSANDLTGRPAKARIARSMTRGQHGK